MSTRIIEFLVDRKRIHQARLELSQQHRAGLKDLYLEIDEALGELDPAVESALSRLLWVLDNTDSSDALIANNIGKGLAALGSSKTPMFF